MHRWLVWEEYISVDVETAGPAPSLYALLAIGACWVADPGRQFYVELQPLTMNFQPEAMAVHGLSLERLAGQGTPPAQAMLRFDEWLTNVVPGQCPPVFVSFNAPFDWMFVADYFHRFLGRNPFGHSALDLKALYMGLYRVPWSETSVRQVAARYLGEPRPLDHHALQDAVDQAELFRRMMAELAGRQGDWDGPSRSKHPHR